MCIFIKNACFFYFRDDINRIPYTTMCIKESLRLYPAVPGMARQLTKTMTFFDGRSMPEGIWWSLLKHIDLVIT